MDLVTQDFPSNHYEFDSKIFGKVIYKSKYRHLSIKLERFDVSVSVTLDNDSPKDVDVLWFTESSPTPAEKQIRDVASEFIRRIVFNNEKFHSEIKGWLETVKTLERL